MRETPLQTRITVPADDVDPLMDALAEAGFLVLDSGERVTTEHALEGEATLEVVGVPRGDDDTRTARAPTGTPDGG